MSCGDGERLQAAPAARWLFGFRNSNFGFLSDFGFRISDFLLPFLLATSLVAATPPAEELLPPETLFVATAPDWTQTTAAADSLPLVRMWRDPAMKPVLAKIGERWQENVITPLERQWGLRLTELLTLPRGQVTVALAPAGARSATTRPGLIFLADCGTNATRLATNLATLKQRWTEAGRNWRAEKLQGRDFAAFSLGGDTPGNLKDAFFPKRVFQDPPGAEPPRLAKPSPAAPGKPGREILVGQVDSLLVISDSASLIEAVTARLAGRELPTLAGQAAFTRQGAGCFRGARFCGWANLSALLARDAASDTNGIPSGLIAQNPENALFMPLRTASLLRALGLDTVEGAAFRYAVTPEGVDSELRLEVRGGKRPRLLEGLSGTSADCAPPPFVPVGAAEFDRWRFNGPKALEALGGALDALSPQSSSAWDFLLDTASEAAKAKNPDFDLRASLTAGLGEDFMHWDVATPGPAGGMRSVYVLASPDSERLLLAIKALMVLLPQPETDLPEQEFLGRKIYSIPLPMIPGVTPILQGPRMLSYSATTGYVVLATEATLVEEFLRGAGAGTKPLLELASLDKARARVTEAGACAFGYWNQRLLAQASFEALPKNPPSGAELAPLLPLPEIIGEPLVDELNIGALIDPSLLPPFERVAKYFHYSVYGLSAGENGFVLKCFAPAPVELIK